MKKILLILGLNFILVNCYAYEVRYKEVKQLFIVDGIVEESKTGAIITLDILDEYVIYKNIEDASTGVIQNQNAPFTILTQGAGIMKSPNTLKENLNNLVKEQNLSSENVIRALYFGGDSVILLLIGESFFLEVKNSGLFANAASYAFYKRINE